MTQEKSLSVSDIAHELDAGKATVKFLLKRFKKWLPSSRVGGQPLYPVDTIKTLFLIQENLETGVLPSEIETKLDGVIDTNDTSLLDPLIPRTQHDSIPLTGEGLDRINTLLDDIGNHQKNIALAHEKRAEVEERKVAALERQAESEEKKVKAMRQIATALQEMNTLTSDSPALEQLPTDDIATLNDKTDISTETGPSIEQDDLSLILGEKDQPADGAMDDLSRLIDKTPQENDEPEPLDDLSQLIDTNSKAEDNQKDIANDYTPLKDMDDLSLPVDQRTGSEENAVESVQIDDLSKKIETQAPSQEDEGKQKPAIKIDVSPEEDLEAYKAAVMKIIIQLKTDGLDVEDATHHLNENQIKTLSGKPEWTPKAISQIYTFIEAAK